MRCFVVIFFSALILLQSSCSTENTTNNVVVPASPNGLTATVISANQVNISWSDNSTNEDGYKIQRKITSGNFVDVASTGIDITSFNDQGLNPSTAYTYRVYAFNAAGNSLQYSNEVTVTTNGTVVNLPSVTIGSQVWSIKNLDVDHYRNGDSIPQVTDPAIWANLTSGAWCYYNNDPANATIYGKLYNWYAVNDPRGLTPNGWHVASENNWNKLIKSIDINSDTICQGCTQSQTAGNALKNTTGWNNPLPGATNNSGLSCLPGGQRSNNGLFSLLGYHGFWWSASEYGQTYAWYRELRYNSASIYRWDYFKSFGFSVRLVKN